MSGSEAAASPPDRGLSVAGARPIAAAAGSNAISWESGCLGVQP